MDAVWLYSRREKSTWWLLDSSRRCAAEQPSMLNTYVAKLGIGNARACPDGAVAHSCRNEHEGRIPRNHRPARRDVDSLLSPGTGPMIEGRSDSEKGSWLFKPRVFFQFEFFSLGLWFCSEYFVVPTTASHRRISHEIGGK